MNKISRRSFLKGAAAGMVGVAAIGMGAVSSAEQVDVGASSIWGEEPTPITDVVETVDVEVLVVGAGTAGLPAALAAVQGGAKTMVIQKTAMSTGIRTYVGAMGTKYQKACGVEISREAIVLDMMRYSSYRADQRLLNLWADKSAEAIDWYGGIMETQGYSIWVDTDLNTEGMHFTEWPTYHKVTDEAGGSPDCAGILIEEFEALGGEIRFETPMKQLIMEDGKCVGVIAENELGKNIRINASKGVILATGGYANNHDMVKALSPSDWNTAVEVNCVAGTDGDGIRAAYWAGAEIDDVHTMMTFERAATLPDKVGGEVDSPNLWWMGSQPFLQVNLLGERVGNESCPYDYDIHLYSEQPGKIWVSLMDDNWQEDVLAFHTIGCSRICRDEDVAVHPGSRTMGFIEMFNGMLLEGGWLQQADTIEELAEKLNLPADNLGVTVNRYNELCDKGYDDDFYKEPFRMRPLRQPPFYGIRNGGSILCSMDGIHIDTNFRALDAAGKPIEGLYAVGNDSGKFFYNTYPELVVGVAAGRSITWGYLCGKQLAEM